MTAPIAQQWFKSSYSGGSGTECVECAVTEGGVVLRDSKQKDQERLSVTHGVWLAFVRALRHGQLPGQA
ncbi:DUF397 domain-containing protein [Streptomyces sp. NPDC002644]